MKKIFTALTVTALALSAAFADVSLEFKQKADFLGDNGKFKYTGYDKNNGCLVFTVKNDFAGAVVDIDPTLAQGSETRSIDFDAYYGWVNFYEGAMQLKSGVFSDRSVNNFDKDGGLWKGTHYKRYNYGISELEGLSISATETAYKLGQDITNISKVYGDQKLATALQYKTEDLFAKLVLVDNQDGYDKGSSLKKGSSLNQKSGFAAEMGMKVGEGSKLNVVFKNPENKAYAVGAFFENTTLKEDLDFVVGFTFARESQLKTGSTTDYYFDYAVDFRARYTLADNMYLTTMNNLSYFGQKTMYALWDMVSLTLNASENLQVLMTAEWEHQDLLNVNGTDHNTVGKLDLIPGVKYIVGEGVDISTGLIMHTTGWSKANAASFEIPFLLHVGL